MYDAEFAVLMVVALGMIAGCGAGLLIGYLAGTQGPEWRAMTRKNKITTILLVIICSAVATGLLSWRFLQ